MSLSAAELETRSREAAQQFWDGQRLESFERDLTDPFHGGGGWRTKQLFSSESGSVLSQLFLSLGGSERLTRPYLQNPWVYRCVNAIVDAINSVPLRIRQSEDVKSDDVTSGPLIELLGRPNPLVTGVELADSISLYHELFGESFLLLLDSSMEPVRGDFRKLQGLPSEILIIPGNIVEVEIDKRSKMPSKIKVRTRDGVEEYPYTSVVHLYKLGPYNPYRGVAPMTAAMRAAAMQYQSERFDEALLSHGGQTGGVYETAGALQAKQVEELRKQHQEMVGDPTQHGKPIVLANGVTYRPTAMTPEQMHMPDLRQWVRDLILATFGVPKPIVMVTDDVNRANAEAAVESFWTGTIVPKLRMRENQITWKFLSRLPAPFNQYVAYYDLSDIDALKENQTQEIENARKLFEMGMSINEAATVTGLELGEIEGGDERFILGTFVPVAQAGQPQNAEASRQMEDPVRAGAERVNGNGKDLADLVDPDLTPEEFTWAKSFDRRSYGDLAEKQMEGQEKRLKTKVQPILRSWIMDVRGRLTKRARTKSLVPENRIEQYLVEQIKQRSTFERELDALLEAGLGRWQERLVDAVGSVLSAAWDEAAEALADELGESGFITSGSESALKFLRSKQIKLAEGVTSTLVDDVRRTILSAMADEGVSVGSLSRRLAESLDAWRGQLSVMANNTPARAERIARTEITSVFNKSRAEEMKEAGVRKHMWITSRDAHVRDSHASLDGRIREVGKVFGFGLKYPGDSSAGASEVVNCRCTTAPAPRES